MSAAELILSTGSTPPAPSSGRITLYAGTDNQLYLQDAAGTVVQLATTTTTQVFAAAAESRPVVSGSRADTPALAALLAALEQLGLIVDATTP